jgi:CRISPR-associated protein (TIGR03986 family)
VTPRDRQNYHQPLTESDTRQVETTVTADEGFVYVTNRNFSRKHDERVFFGPPVRKKVDAEILRAWSVLVADYRNAHREADIHGRTRNGQPVPPWEWIDRDPGKTAWGPHFYNPTWTSLHPGDLCYAELNERTQEVVGLYPVLVSRKLFQVAPKDLLDRSLWPAEERTKLSPADRVFGWVNGSGDGAYRGQLRVGPVDTSAARVETFTDRDEYGVPLAILGQPKPQQGRFYAAAGPPDRPQPFDQGTAKDKLYVRSSTLRGRKVYPHHAELPAGYWDDPTTDRTQENRDGRFQEYRRPHKEAGDGALVDGTRFATYPTEEQRDNQNRSVTGWVAPGSAFRFALDVRNLSTIELGALLWVLTLPPKHFHRLGLGKPLGFGSVRVELDEAQTALRTGEHWRAYYAGFADALPGDGPETSNLIAAFKEASENTWRGRPHLAAFLAAARGDEHVPVHYPRIRPAGMDRAVPVPPDPRGQAYAWFVENEREQNRTLVHGESLPAAGGDPLTVYPARDKPRDGR